MSDWQVNTSGQRRMPIYPMAQCLDGRHPPFNLETHPNGCPIHLADAALASQPAPADPEWQYPVPGVAVKSPAPAGVREPEPTGETWRCPSCRDTTAVMGMCQRCGVFGIRYEPAPADQERTPRGFGVGYFEMSPAPAATREDES